MNEDTKIETPRFYEIVREAFAKFLQSNGDTDDQIILIKVLKKIENEFKKFGGIKQTKDKSLWLRYFKGDTLATTIRDIEMNINPLTSSHGNHIYALECIELAIAPDSGMELHFS